MRCRLVQQQYLCLLRQCARQQNQLKLSTGKLGVGTETDSLYVEFLHGLLCHLHVMGTRLGCRSQVGIASHEHDILDSVWEGRRMRLWNRCCMPADVACRQRLQVVSLDEDRPRPGGQQSFDTVK